MKNTLYLHDYFEPSNPSHLDAWRKLNENGSWPEGFIPENVQVAFGSKSKITFKIANSYACLRNQIEGELEYYKDSVKNPTVYDDDGEFQKICQIKLEVLEKLI